MCLQVFEGKAFKNQGTHKDEPTQQNEKLAEKAQNEIIEHALIPSLNILHYFNSFFNTFFKTYSTNLNIQDVKYF